ncbi:MAG: radical SAM protein [Dehalococcoidia bacterium]|nr:radical SAM protein [Dehalococcoidia bacterium]
MSTALHSALRLLLPGAKSSFVFERQQPVVPQEPKHLNLYVHLPFCARVCPFCPYVKHAYDADLSRAYRSAILKELDGYWKIWGNVAVESVYFGGGTPSLTPEIVEETLSWLAGHFQIGSEVGVEIHPLTASEEVLRRLKNAGVTMASLGVQSFNERLLDLLGRGYGRDVALSACERFLDAGFATTDVDLMFALPTQSIEEAIADFETACALGVDQVSAYPLIPFSYTSLENHLRERGVALPSARTERRMLGSVVESARRAGYERTSIWSFNKPGAMRYTTVTRDSFVGIGAGATSRFGDYFWLTTFSVEEYIRSMKDGNPSSLSTELSASDKMAYWLFWQCYNLSVDLSACKAVYGRDLPTRVHTLFRLLALCGLAVWQDSSTVRFTDRGAYLFHLVEKAYTQSYLKTMWEVCLGEAWPERVVL